MAEPVAMGPIVAIYLRLPMREVERLRAHPEVLPKYDPRVALGDGRAVDLGRAWEELGVLLDGTVRRRIAPEPRGMVRLPDRGPTVGEELLGDSDSRAAWSYVEPARVCAIAEELARQKSQLRGLYAVDGEGTDPAHRLEPMAAARTGGHRDGQAYLYAKLAILAAHYAAAAAHGEAMVVRLGERL